MNAERGRREMWRRSEHYLFLTFRNHPRHAPHHAVTPSYNRMCFAASDGNEYTGWAEFVAVERLCQPQYIALHDMGTLKTARVEDYLHRQ